MMTVTGLSIKYLKTARQAVRELSFSMKPGEKLALLGSSGCGKTSVLNFVLGLLPPEEVLVEGRLSGREGRLSAVFGNPALFPWLSVASNVAFPLAAAGLKMSEARGRIAGLLEMGGLADCAGYLPAQLSAGMQQRASFLRALAASPELIILDEPFSSLDVRTKEQLMNDFLVILAERGVSALFVTHDLREALTMGDRILMLSGSPARFKKEYALAGLSPAQKAALLPEIAGEYEN